MKTTKKNKMENDLKKKWKTNQSTKINLIGCDTIVNSPSWFCGRFLTFEIFSVFIMHNSRVDSGVD